MAALPRSELYRSAKTVKFADQLRRRGHFSSRIADTTAFPAGRKHLAVRKKSSQHSALSSQPLSLRRAGALGVARGFGMLLINHAEAYRRRFHCRIGRLGTVAACAC